MVWVNNFQVTVDCYGHHECDAGRAVDGHHEEGDVTEGRAEYPTVAAAEVVDLEWQTGEQQEIGHHHVQQEHCVRQGVWHAAAEDPECQHGARQAQQELDGQECRQHIDQQQL